jgi:penicillin-binding protein 1A
VTERRRTREDIKKAREMEKKKNQSPLKTWLKRIVLAVVAVGVALFIGGAGLFAYYVSKAPELDEEALKDPISSEIYDVNGDLFATIGGGENRKYIEYEDIPQEMIDAIIATEDARFFDHFGIDIWRLGGAVVANLRDGFGAQGASTITQQVVKNSFFTNEKKLERKAQEAWLAIQLERQYSKEEIFEMYFNKVLMSGTVYGFGTAAEYFYGKELKDLELEEMALLAGMPQSPNNYNPFKNPERAAKRRDIVLSLMVQHDKISETEAKAAKETDVTAGLLPEEERKTNLASKYPAFLDVVLNELGEKEKESLLAEGIKVYTTLDPAAQEIVESVMNDDSNFPTETIQSGVSVIDTQTGAIAAIGGGRHYQSRTFNYADDRDDRQPGSTLKPLVDYGPAIEYLKWSTGETLVDEPMNYTNSSQPINNWDSKYMGTMTARKALYASRNVPAVKTLNEVGAEKSKEFISKLGIEVDHLVESDAIGGGKVYISPIQMAASYAAFGNEGIYTDPYAISKIEYRDGSTESLKPKSAPAMSDATAYMVTDMLRDVVSSKPNASAPAANVPGVDVAGKTGTTNYSADDFKKYNLPSSAVPDSWFAGYSTNYSIAIWSGYHERKDPITTWEERRLPQKLFKSIMTDLSKNVSNTKFKQPNSVTSATIVVGSNPLKLAGKNTPSHLKSTELFVKGTAPKEVSTEVEEEVEIEAPTDVYAKYDDVGQQIELTWSHNDTADEGDEEPVNYTYEVTMQIDDGEPIAIQTSGSKQAVIPNVQLGSTYTFSVVATDGENRSAPGTVSLYIEGTETEEPEEPEVEEPEVEDPEQQPGNNNGNGNNGNQNGNGNQNNNGNQNGNGNQNNNGNQNGNGNQNNNGSGNNPDNGQGDQSGTTPSVPPTTPTPPTTEEEDEGEE